MTEVTRWTSPDGRRIRDFIALETTGRWNDERKSLVSPYIDRAGSGRGTKLQPVTRTASYTYGMHCNSGTKECIVDDFVRALLAPIIECPTMDLTSLTEIGRLLYGEDWQRPLARGLGPLHPDGARESIDDRLVRRWAAGDRPIPAWVGQAVLKLMLKGATVYEKRARALRMRADELRGEIGPIQLIVPEQEESPVPRM